ncbi:hypothetical protein CCE02nite_33660 [Cellulosimicrobium cellulans]|uniref:Uncharacterized protein n=1 Tax=Cellulosimicrobium cellulans TaxID=1710 RepID=A0A4Y4E316_CELCE|nr:hypothetical protein CCE02nite_33660 [Cellulosimicrobium cellulans]
MLKGAVAVAVVLAVGVESIRVIELSVLTCVVAGSSGGITRQTERG